MYTVSIEKDKFYKDGKPFQILAGSIHYYRVVPEYWEDRLRKLKECGMNAVETCTCWNLHERKEGTFDFTGQLDLVRFIKTAEKLDISVILRPGPYICGEWDMGGLPSWLLGIPGMRLRCFHEGFLEKVRNYYRELFRLINPLLSTNGGNVIAVQIENEYGSFGDDENYMQAVLDIYRENHVDCLLFTSDGPGYFMLSGGSVKGQLATINFGSNPKDNFALLSNFQPNKPLMCMEYWNGWFDHWYEEHHTRGGQDTANVFEEMLNMGVSVNFYMMHGGTNFGFNNGANFDKVYQPTITSYDYNCPISECGDLTEKYYAIREVIERKFGKLPPLTVKDPVKLAYGEVYLEEQADLLSLIELNTQPVRSAYLQTMEEIGQDFGFLLYKSTVRGPIEKIELTIEGLADRAHIFFDGKLLGIKENTGHRDDQVFIGLAAGEEGELMILTENLGRVNYGGHIYDKKGITVGVKLASRYHFGWEMYPMTLDDISVLKYQQMKEAVTQPESFMPKFLRGHLVINELADTFVRLDGFQKGCVFINGFNLGRYYNTAGPQKTLYLPAPLLRLGENEIVVLELDGYEKNVIQLTDQEDLG